MAEVTPPRSDPTNIEWTEKISANGNSYRVGVVPKDGAAQQPDALKDNMAQTRAPFDIDVYWPAKDNPRDDWHWTDGDVKYKAFVERYKVVYDPGVFYDYTICIHNTESAQYRFFDESGDYYDLGADIVNDHFVNYNSKKPDIVKVTGFGGP